MSQTINYHQIFQDFAYVDKEILIDMISQIEDKTQVISTLESLFPKPEGWTPVPPPPQFNPIATFTIPLMPSSPATSLSSSNMPPSVDLINLMTNILSNINLNVVEIQGQDKDIVLMTEIIKNKCRNVRCYTCNQVDDFLKTMTTKYGDEFTKLFEELIVAIAGPNFLYTTMNLKKMYDKIIMIKKSKVYKKFNDKFGDHVGHNSLCCISNKVFITLFEGMEHLVPQMIELLRKKVVDVEYALLFNIPEYELDEFLPAEQRKGMNEEMIKEYKTKLTILDKKDLTEPCTICFENLNSEDNDSECVELLCKHEFHWNCIEELLKINASCPLCKKNLKESE